MLIQPREFNVRKTVTVLIVLSVVFVFWTCRQHDILSTPATQNFSGETMGTLYHIILVTDQSPEELLTLYGHIDEILKSVNRSMSTYISNSEISVFNRLPVNREMSISDEFAFVLRQSLYYSEATGGAFDPALGRLINLWGFGPATRTNAPGESEIADAMENSGWHCISLTNNVLKKIKSGVELNLGAVAKGYGVDRVSEEIERAGITNYMVEIGGEVRASGCNASKVPWRIGVDRPIKGNSPGENLLAVLNISNAAVATSGDYRNYQYDEQGVAYTHIIDPGSGRPAKVPAVSVTVAASTCLEADALATALFVMGPEKGLEWMRSYDGAAEALFISNDKDGRLVKQSTLLFDDYTNARWLD